MSQFYQSPSAVTPPPAVPTSFITDSGTAIPVANILNMYAKTGYNNGSTVLFTGSGNTVDLHLRDASDNILLGDACGNNTLTGGSNVALGTNCLTSLTSGNYSIAIGAFALNGNTSGSPNIGIGLNACKNVSTGTVNIGIGDGALASTNNSQNVAIGSNALTTTSGGDNTGVGFHSLNNLGGGSRNTSIGTGSGTAYTGTESNNALFYHPGVLGDNNTLRLGQSGVGNFQQNKCFLAGTSGVSVTGGVLNINASDQIGQIAPGTNGNILTSNGTNWTSAAPTALNAQTFTTDSGVATAALNNVNVFGKTGYDNGASVLFTGSGSTVDFHIRDANQNIFIGGACGNTSLTGTHNIGMGDHAFANLTSTSDNFAAGQYALTSLTSGGDNTGIGYHALFNMIDGGNNIAIGQSSNQNNAHGSHNITLGYNSGSNITSSDNVGIGFLTLATVTSGGANIAIGSNAGNSLTTTDSNNILISSTGVSGDNNIIRLGTNGTGAQQQNKCYVAGIQGQYINTPSLVSLDPTTGQLGNYTPNKVINLVDDFLGVSIPAANEYIAAYSYYASNFNISGDTSAHPGVLSNASFALNDTWIFLSNNSSAIVPQVILGGGAIVLNWIVNVAILSTVTNTYTLRVGLGDTKNADEANGCYFEYTNGVNSGNWQYKTAAASVRTTNNSTTAVTAAWHNLQIAINAAGTSVSFFVDGVSLGTAITTNIPTLAITPFVDIVRSAGTIAANSVQIDTMYMNQVLTTAR